MKKILWCVLFLAAAGVANAETIYLKSGTTVNGKIKDKTDNSVVVDVGGATVTYYKDEIDRIDDTTAAPAAPAAPAADAAAPASQAPAAPAAPISDAKKQLILQFIDVFGTKSSMAANFDQMMASLKPEEAQKLRNAFKVDEIIERLLPLYDKYFSEADLTAMIAFYSSPEGKKLVQTIPQLMRDSVEVSAKYFEAKMPEEFKNPPAGAAAGAAAGQPAAPAAK